MNAKGARVQHVSISYRAGEEARARAFYGGLLGLPEVPPPETLKGVIWYRLEETELHLFVDASVDAGDGPDSRRHLCVAWADEGGLAGLRARLREAGVDTEDSTPIPGRPRFFCRDPFGNRLEFTAITGDYLTADVGGDAGGEGPTSS